MRAPGFLERLAAGVPADRRRMLLRCVPPALAGATLLLLPVPYMLVGIPWLLWRGSQ